MNNTPKRSHPQQPIDSKRKSLPMPITQHRMMALIAAADAFAQSLKDVKEALVAEGYDEMQLNAVFAINQPAPEHIEVVAQEKAHFRVMSGRNYNAMRRARLRRGTLEDHDFAEAVQQMRKHKKRKVPPYSGEKKLALDHARTSLEQKIPKPPSQQDLSHLKSAVRPHTDRDIEFMNTGAPEGTPERLEPYPEDDITIDRESEEYQQYLKEQGELKPEDLISPEGLKPKAKG